MQRPERMLITKFTGARNTKFVATGVQECMPHFPSRVHTHWFSTECVPDVVQGTKLQHSRNRALFSGTDVLVRALRKVASYFREAWYSEDSTQDSGLEKGDATRPHMSGLCFYRNTFSGEKICLGT